MKDSILTYVIDHLDHEKGNWPQIAADTGVPYRTLQKIGSGKTRSPRIEAVETLARYFRDKPQQAA